MLIRFGALHTKLWAVYLVHLQSHLQPCLCHPASLQPHRQLMLPKQLTPGSFGVPVPPPVAHTLPMQSHSLSVINFEVGWFLLHLRRGSALRAGSIDSCYMLPLNKFPFICNVSTKSTKQNFFRPQTPPQASQSHSLRNVSLGLFSEIAIFAQT